MPYNAPNTLYYYCQFHSSMGGTINISDIGPTGSQGIQGAAGVNGEITISLLKTLVNSGDYNDFKTAVNNL